MNEIIRLSDLPAGKAAIIESVQCADYLRNRVMDMGIITGAQIKPLLIAPFGDPIAYAAKNTLIAIRRRDSRDILVRRRHE